MVHVVGYLVRWTVSGRLVLGSKRQPHGWAAFAGLCLLCVISIPPIRKHSYGMFWHAHWMGYVMMIVAVSLYYVISFMAVNDLIDWTVTADGLACGRGMEVVCCCVRYHHLRSGAYQFACRQPRSFQLTYALVYRSAAFSKPPSHTLPSLRFPSSDAPASRCNISPGDGERDNMFDCAPFQQSWDPLTLLRPTP